MKLEVKNLVFAGVGANESFSIELYNEQIDEEVLAERIHGTVKITRLEEEILADFTLKVKVKLICDRCLGNYETEIPLEFKQIYKLAQDIDDEEPAVDKNFSIDVSEPVRQEIITNLPVKKLCLPGCKGLCDHCGKNLNTEKCSCPKKSK